MRTFFGLALIVVFAAAAYGQLRVDPIEMKQRTLSNGLRVVTVQDNSNPTASLHV